MEGDEEKSYCFCKYTHRNLFFSGFSSTTLSFNINHFCTTGSDSVFLGIFFFLQPDDSNLFGAVKRILQQYLKKLNTYYSNQIINVLHGPSYNYPEDADNKAKKALDEKAASKLAGFKAHQYDRLLDRQSLLKSRASSLHGFLCKQIEEALKRDAITFYVCKMGILGETMLIPAIKETADAEPTFYFMTDGLNVQDV